LVGFEPGCPFPTLGEVVGRLLDQAQRLSARGFVRRLDVEEQDPVLGLVHARRGVGQRAVRRHRRGGEGEESVYLPA